MNTKHDTYKTVCDQQLWLVTDAHSIPASTPHQLHRDLVHLLHAADLLDDEAVRQEDHTTYHTTGGEKEQEEDIIQ